VRYANAAHFLPPSLSTHSNLHFFFAYFGEEPNPNRTVRVTHEKLHLAKKVSLELKFSLTTDNRQPLFSPILLIATAVAIPVHKTTYIFLSQIIIPIIIDFIIGKHEGLLFDHSSGSVSCAS
jgi:hypothetical protein